MQLESLARFGGDVLGPYVSKKTFKSGTDFHNEFDRWTFGAALGLKNDVSCSALPCAAERAARGGVNKPHLVPSFDSYNTVRLHRINY